MPLITLDETSLAYGEHVLLDHVQFQIDRGERVCLVGRNGAGKSTLMKVIAGQVQVDEGERWLQPALRISYLEQDVPPGLEQSIFECVAEGLGEVGDWIRAYHDAARRVAEDPSDAHLHELDAWQRKLESGNGWNLNQKVDLVLSKLQLPADLKIAELSGGMRRRVLLAKALVYEPDLLLLDEPTNHLDIESILWLESYLTQYPGALVFITHDRTFLRNLSTRILELDRGVLTSYNGDYAYYLRRKDEEWQVEEKELQKLDKKLSQEEAWIRQGIKARRKRNQGRVRALEALRQQRAGYRQRQGQASFSLESGDLAGKIVVDVRHVDFAYANKTIINDFSTRILRGDRIGLIGANGSGKSTLLRIILGQLAPQGGSVVMGTRLEIAYFDQQREQLQYDKTVRQNLSDGHDHVSVRGKRRHVISYLRDFLFPPTKVDMPVKALSGGERNRLLLAKIFTQSANLLVLDEPTNDLDVDTLELLEELLAEYEGTLILVSHDRTFLDQVVTSTLVFEGEGAIQEYVGGYEDYLRQRKSAPAAQRKTAAVKDAADAATERSRSEGRNANRVRKLSYKEQRELEQLPELIDELEKEQAGLHERMGEADFYQQDKDHITQTLERLQAIEQELEQAYARWAELDAVTG